MYDWISSSLLACRTCSKINGVLEEWSLVPAESAEAVPDETKVVFRGDKEGVLLVPLEHVHGNYPHSASEFIIESNYSNPFMCLQPMDLIGKH